MFVIVLILLLGYGAIIVYMYTNQASFMYFPDRTWTNTPADAGIAYDDVWLTTADGVKISGWFVPAPNATNETMTVLFLHGNGGSIGGRVPMCQIFNRLGYNFFLIDYRGYGKSEGRPTEQGTYQDAEQAWHYLTETRQTPPDQIIVWGESLGGGVASWLVARHQPRAWVLHSTFTSAVDIAASEYWWLPVSPLMHYRYETLPRLAHIHAPVLVIHSPDDELIPYSQAKTLYKTANDPKLFLKVSGPHVGDWIFEERYFGPLQKSLRNLVRLGKQTAGH